MESMNNEDYVSLCMHKCMHVCTCVCVSYTLALASTGFLLFLLSYILLLPVASLSISYLINGTDNHLCYSRLKLGRLLILPFSPQLPIFNPSWSPIGSTSILQFQILLITSTTATFDHVTTISSPNSYNGYSPSSVRLVLIVYWNCLIYFFIIFLPACNLYEVGSLFYFAYHCNQCLECQTDVRRIGSTQNIKE